MERIESLASYCNVATPRDTVLNSECALTFRTTYTAPGGIIVNLGTFVGTTQELAFSGEGGEKGKGEKLGLFVRIVKRRVEREKKKETDSVDDSRDAGGDGDDKGAEGTTAPPTKLGVGMKGGFASEDDLFETVSTYSIVLLEKSSSSDGAVEVVSELPYDESTRSTFPTQVALSADSIISHAGLAVQQDLTAWELDDDPKPVSKYAEDLPFVDNGVAISPDPSKWKVRSHAPVRLRSILRGDKSWSGPLERGDPDR